MISVHDDRLARLEVAADRLIIEPARAFSQSVVDQSLNSPHNAMCRAVTSAGSSKVTRTVPTVAGLLLFTRWARCGGRAGGCVSL
jgi:hypothetical protein